MRGWLAELRFFLVVRVCFFRIPPDALSGAAWLPLDKADSPDRLERRDDALAALSPLVVEGPRDAGRRWIWNKLLAPEPGAAGN